jgi:hypothetical protein
MRTFIAVAVVALLVGSGPVAFAQSAASNTPRFIIEKVIDSRANDEVWVLDTVTGAVRVCSTAASGDIASDGPKCTPWTK